MSDEYIIILTFLKVNMHFDSLRWLWIPTNNFSYNKWAVCYVDKTMCCKL